MTEHDVMGISGGISDTNDLDMDKLTAMPINELAELPAEIQAQLPVDIQAKLLVEMDVDKCKLLLDKLPPSTAAEVVAKFSELAMRSVMGEDSHPALGEDEEENDDTALDIEDDDDEDQEEEDDEEDEPDEDDGEDDTRPSFLHRNASSVPTGKRVILRRDFKSDGAYCDAVVKSMQAVLRKNGIRAVLRDVCPGVKVFAFDKTTRGVDIDCRVLCEYERFNYRIEFKFNVSNQPGRTPLIDYFCQDKNFPLRYGALIMDHRDNEKKLEYSSCFRGAFSEEAFVHYYDLLCSTLTVYAREYAKIAGEKKLEPDQRKLVKSMLHDLAICLPARVKPENEERLTRVVEVLGGHMSASQKKLLNYIVEHIK